MFQYHMYRVIDHCVFYNCGKPFNSFFPFAEKTISQLEFVAQKSLSKKWVLKLQKIIIKTNLSIWCLTRYLTKHLWRYLIVNMLEQSIFRAFRHHLGQILRSQMAPKTLYYWKFLIDANELSGKFLDYTLLLIYVKRNEL